MLIITKKAILLWLMLSYGGVGVTQYAINSAGGQHFGDKNNFQYSVGEAASLTLYSINQSFYATTGVLQPDPFLINFNNELIDYAPGLFPNPALVSIQFLSAKSGLHFKIMNAEAKILMSGIWEGRPVYVDHLPPGFYVIRVSDPDNSKFKSIKFIKI